VSTPSTQVRYDSGATHEYSFESAKKLLATSFDRTKANLKARRFGVPESILRKGLSLFVGGAGAVDEKLSIDGVAPSAWMRGALEFEAPFAGAQAHVLGNGAAVEQPERNRDPPGCACDEHDDVAIDVRCPAGPTSAQHAQLAVASPAYPPHAVNGGTSAHDLRSHHAPRAAERGWTAADPQEAAVAPLPPAFRDGSRPVRNGVAHRHRPDLALTALGPRQNVGDRDGRGGVPTTTAGGPLPMQANQPAAAHTSARTRCAPYSHDAAHAVIAASRAAASAEVRARQAAASSAVRAASSGRVPAQMSTSLGADMHVPWLRERPPAAEMTMNHIGAAPFPVRELPDGHARV
jgi:hypothetical protein